MKTSIKLKIFILSPLIKLIVSSNCYTNEPPVKLLEVGAVADRFPASNSSYRISITNGYVSFLNMFFQSLYVLLKDEDSGRTEAEEKNGFPEKMLILNPHDGCAEYLIPLNEDEEQHVLMLFPGRKDNGAQFPDYCNKGGVEVELTLSNQSISSSCFVEEDNCLATTCAVDFESILMNETRRDTPSNIGIKLCVLESGTNYTAAVWEIDVSKVCHTFMNKF